MRSRNLLGMLAIAGAISLHAGLASAAITLDSPIAAGTGITVTGTGASVNGPVELFVNGVSQGSVQADGVGDFSFAGIDVAENDELTATASQVWNFNTDGDFENWAVASGGTGSVSGGNLVVTGDGTTNITLNLFDNVTPPIWDTNVTRVFEMRFRISGAFTPGSGSTVIFDPGGAFAFGQGWNPQVTTDFITSHVDLSTGSDGNPNTYTSTGTSDQLAIGANGFGAGAVLEVDYIRVAEGFTWDFDHDNDAELWSAQTNLDPVTVAGGVLTGAAQSTDTGANGSPSIWLPFNWVDTDHFTVWSHNSAVNSSVSGQGDILAWIDNGGTDGYYVNGNSTNQDPTDGFNHLFTADGTFQEFSLDLATAGGATWGQDPTSMALIYSPFVNVGAVGETFEIDYMSLYPASPLGPSATVTAVAGANVEDWLMY